MGKCDKKVLHKEHDGYTRILEAGRDWGYLGFVSVINLSAGPPRETSSIRATNAIRCPGETCVMTKLLRYSAYSVTRRLVSADPRPSRSLYQLYSNRVDDHGMFVARNMRGSLMKAWPGGGVEVRTWPVSWSPRLTVREYSSQKQRSRPLATSRTTTERHGSNLVW